MGETGHILRAAREARGLSLADAEEATKIRRRYIAALEEGRMADLPGIVYARGFLKIYARFLDLDPDDLSFPTGVAAPGQAAESSPERLPSGAPVEAVHPTRAPAVRPGRPAAPARRVGRPRPDSRLTQSAQVRRPMRWSTLIVTLAVAGLMVYGFVYYYRSTRTETIASPPPQAPMQPVTPPPVSSPPPQPAPPPPAAPTPRVVKGPVMDGAATIWATPGPLQVTLVFRERSWYEIQLDGQKATDETPPPGARRSFTAQKSADIRIGWTEMVDVIVNGETFTSPASEGNRNVAIRVGEPPANP